MFKYMLLMRGSQNAFATMTQEEQMQVIEQHLAWSRHLASNGILVEGNGFDRHSVQLVQVDGKVEERKMPFAGTEYELSGFYIIEADTIEAAVELAYDCPALMHGETVEVVQLGH